ncbi:dTMP kinase [Marinobacter nauticus]|uniref:dTMP kinase n=1 Tax=Marinobacter nauticus TaxID=2743 RepID=UPI001C9442C5|nr:dTMP kinase [Marinobacter nauticus]MBY6221533.1 dTMP kinase [Marinobacter nauticus]
MKGKFIVFEGLDGSGTSTQASLLRDYFLSLKSSAYLTSEPSDGPIGTMIRQAFKGRINFPKGSISSGSGDLFDQQMAYLFAADRHDHLYNEVDGVFKHLEEGATVISTRYFFSSYAYHCQSEDDFSLVKDLNSKFPNPDLVVYLKAPVEVSINRLHSRPFRDEYENEKKLRIVSENYERIFTDYQGEFLTIDANRGIQEIHECIIDKVKSLA